MCLGGGGETAVAVGAGSPGRVFCLCLRGRASCVASPSPERVRVTHSEHVVYAVCGLPRPLFFCIQRRGRSDRGEACGRILCVRGAV
jgi:hypothetical protein